ncbi:MAG: 5-formyltetrahydrofolate cyclo-ligase [Ruminococcus sp.]|nr:5-formyltetrahydrofolate cyclo-ligase [Ruminococcus sp.]
MTDKKTLRKKFSALRKELKSDTKDAVITAGILSLEQVINADVVLLYASFSSEISTWELAQQLISTGKTVAFPRCGENGHMTFHTVTDLSQLKCSSAGKYNIREPESFLPQPLATDLTVCVVPGLAFTEYGGRLGYGGGFYDRFLAEHPYIRTIALAYEGMIADDLPVLEHDFTVDMIITEERTFYCNEQ